MKTSAHYDWKRRRDASAFLALENGDIFRGHSVGAPVDRPGEVVFNTGMTGYQEILSDPSYAGQFVCLTAPEIGNYGVNSDDMESRDFFAAGLLAHRISNASNWRSQRELAGELIDRNTPAIAGIDTRSLTTAIREQGAMKAFLSVTGRTPEKEAVERARQWEGLAGQDSVSRVSCACRYAWEQTSETVNPAGYRVVAYDFGIKWNMARSLREAGMAVTIVPAGTAASDVLAMRPDGVFLSNGPGDPAGLGYAIAEIRKLLGRVPVMGICLGHQLLGVALGGKTYKLPFGHHGCNHPVKDFRSRKTLITSQNHNYAVCADSILDAAEVTHASLNDESVEGIRARDYPAFSVQFHPEAAPGPHDAQALFMEFRRTIAIFRQ